MPHDTISVIIPVYNRADKIGPAIESILNQTSSVDEIIVVDDASTDNVAGEIRSLFGNLVSVVIHEQNKGNAAARQTGYLRARSEWVAYLDSDDIWPLDRIERIRRTIQIIDLKTVVIFGDMKIHTQDGGYLSHFESKGFKPIGASTFIDTKYWLYPTMYPYFQSSVIRRSILLELNVFEEGLRIGTDLLAFAQLCSRGSFVVIPDVTCVHDRKNVDIKLSVHLKEINNPDFAFSRMAAIKAFNIKRSNSFYIEHYENWARLWIKKQLILNSGINIKISDVCEQFRFRWAFRSLLFTLLIFVRLFLKPTFYKSKIKTNQII